MAPRLLQQQRQGRGPVHATIFVFGLLSTLLDATHAVQWIVGDGAHWSYLHADTAESFYNDWAASKTFSTGDTLLFQYDNSTHTVLQLATGSDFLVCNLKASIAKWSTGSDSVFISKAGTFYYVCGSPSHCEQGMRFSITATGADVAAPPGSTDGTTAQAPTANDAASSASLYGRGLMLLVLAMALAGFA